MRGGCFRSNTMDLAAKTNDLIHMHVNVNAQNLSKYLHFTLFLVGDRTVNSICSPANINSFSFAWKDESP